MHDNNQPTSQPSRNLHLTIRNREQILFDRDVKNISSVNKNGPFDVLLQHAHFISIIQEKITVRHEDGKVEEMPIDHGILKVKGNRIKVFLGVKSN